jgi:hypothetical protein
MVCYARRATGILSVAIVAMFLYGGSTAHLLNIAPLLVSLAIVLGGAAIAAVAAFVALRSVRRRRSLNGGCVSCQLRCQHAMTGAPPARLWLISTTDRGAPVPEKTLIPMPRVPVRDTTGPRWPDRPLITTGRYE